MAEHTSLSDALAAAQAEYPRIEKASKNPHFKTNYADLADGMGPIRPILAKHGIAYTQTFHVADGILMLRTKLRWRDQEEMSELPIAQPAKPQDFVALTTYYRRVALFSIAGITPGGEDDDGSHANDVASTQEPPRQGKPAAKANGNGHAAKPYTPTPEEAVADTLAEQDAHDPLRLAGVKGAAGKRDVLIMGLENAATAAECDRIWAAYRERMRALDKTFGPGEWQRIEDYVVERIKHGDKPVNIMAAG